MEKLCRKKLEENFDSRSTDYNSASLVKQFETNRQIEFSNL